MKNLNRLFHAGRKMTRTSKAAREMTAGVAMFEPLESRMMQSASPITTVNHVVSEALAPALLTLPNPASPLSIDPILLKYNSLGGAAGFLGQPVGTEAALANGGHSQVYQNGEILYSPATGAHYLQGQIQQMFGIMGGAGAVGYPTIDDAPYFDAGNNYYCTFSGGGAVITNTAAGPAYYMAAPIYSTWVSNGGEYGRNGKAQGLPTSNTQTFGGVQISYFQDEKIIVAANGQTSVVPAETSMSFTGNITFTGVDLSGSVSLTVNQNGSYSFKWNIKGTYTGEYDIVLALVSPSGVVYTFAETGAANVFSASGSNTALAGNWADLEGASVYAAGYTLGNSNATQTTFIDATVRQVEQSIPYIRSVISVVAQEGANL